MVMIIFYNKILLIRKYHMYGYKILYVEDHKEFVQGIGKDH